MSKPDIVSSIRKDVMNIPKLGITDSDILGVTIKTFDKKRVVGSKLKASAGSRGELKKIEFVNHMNVA